MTLWRRLFLDHVRQPPAPQSYPAHFRTAFWESCKLLVAALVGMIHAVVPAVAPFYTSTRVIRCYRGLSRSGRHEQEIRRELQGGGAT